MAGWINMNVVRTPMCMRIQAIHTYCVTSMYHKRKLFISEIFVCTLGMEAKFNTVCVHEFRIIVVVGVNVELVSSFQTPASPER